MNILTFDVEEWFHLLDNDSTRSAQQWEHYEVRIYGNADRLLRILEETDTRGTFFIIGWIARKYPDVVRRIADRYQIGSHTMNHQLVWQQSRKEFRKDVVDSVHLLEDITGKKVKCFRAPGFSIRESEAWAFEVLNELGIKYDSSVFPARHAHGGMASYPYTTPGIIRYGESEIKEFPVSFKQICGRHVIFQGGGYFRLFPYGLIRRWARESGDYLLSYIHPRDLDAGQPMISELPLARKFKSYVGLKGAEEKLRKFLTDFRFTDIATADILVDWNTAPVIAFNK